VEAQAALVGPDGVVELYPETLVDLDLALVVHPGHPEHDHPVRLAYPFVYLPLDEFGVLGYGRLKGLHDLLYRLVEFRLSRVLGLDLGDNVGDVGHRHLLIS